MSFCMIIPFRWSWFVCKNEKIQRFELVTEIFSMIVIMKKLDYLVILLLLLIHRLRGIEPPTITVDRNWSVPGERASTRNFNFEWWFFMIFFPSQNPPRLDRLLKQFTCRENSHRLLHTRSNSMSSSVRIRKIHFGFIHRVDMFISTKVWREG